MKFYLKPFVDVKEWSLMMRANDVEMESLHIERKEAKMMKEMVERERRVREG